MRRFHYFFIICSIMAFTCKKGKPGFDGITGNWELIEMQAGMMPTQHPAPLTERLIISSYKFQIHTKDSVVNSIYSIVQDPNVEKEVCLDIAPGKYTQRIILHDAHHQREIYFQLDGVELKTLSGCFALDGGVYKRYVRLGDTGNAVD